ncbi:MAG: hypothetical protein LBT40_18495 [Deltaproteobacteria bacterium]|nr:hypothetical protein [Deltaproteobacteria bacterium]
MSRPPFGLILPPEPGLRAGTALPRHRTADGTAGHASGSGLHLGRWAGTPEPELDSTCIMPPGNPTVLGAPPAS